jgi:LemA protein
MKKSYIILGSIGLFVLILFISYWSSYNKAIKLQENVDEAWGNVGATYQLRAELVPQLLGTVKGAAENEKEILTKVTNARAGVVNAKTPEDMELMGKKINTAINLAFEAYPQIRSTENFSILQAQLEGTENRINKARQDYNGVIKEYNSHIRGFFNSMFLNQETFPKKSPFAAAAGTEVAPTVDFSTK